MGGILGILPDPPILPAQLSEDAMPPIFLTPRDAFAYQFQVREMAWSAYNVSRMLRLTGERPARVTEMRAILGDLGMGHDSWHYPDGVFDHGDIWGQTSWPLINPRLVPTAIVGHPYQISEEERRLLAALPRSGTLRVAVDDHPGYYGHGTHHVRVELIEPRRPYTVPGSTPKTRAAARAARKAFAEMLTD
jgi:hypothetical protein